MKHSRAVRILAVCANLLQSAVACVLPAFAYAWVYNSYTRWTWEVYVHWGIAMPLGLVGCAAAALFNGVLLALHLACATLAGAALAAHNTVVFAQLENRCSLIQVAFSGCTYCSCAAANTCTRATLASDPACRACTAPDAIFCSTFRNVQLIVALTGAATVAAMLIPAACSFLLLMRVAARFATDRAETSTAAIRVNEDLYTRQQGGVAMPVELSKVYCERLEASSKPEHLELAATLRDVLAAEAEQLAATLGAAQHQPQLPIFSESPVLVKGDPVDGDVPAYWQEEGEGDPEAVGLLQGGGEGPSQGEEGGGPDQEERPPYQEGRPSQDEMQDALEEAAPAETASPDELYSQALQEERERRKSLIQKRRPSQPPTRSAEAEEGASLEAMEEGAAGGQPPAEDPPGDPPGGDESVARSVRRAARERRVRARESRGSGVWAQARRDSIARASTKGFSM